MDDQKTILIHVGARGRLGLSVERILRSNDMSSRVPTFACPPKELQKSALRLAVSSQTPVSRNDLFETLELDSNKQRIFLSNQHIWASPENVLKKGELYSEAEIRCAAIARSLSEWKIIFILEVMPVHTLLYRFRGEKFRQEARNSSWWQLYDFSWYELVKSTLMSSPEVEVALVPTEYLALYQKRLVELIVGKNFPGRLKNDLHLLKRSIDKRGEKLLDAEIANSENNGSSISLEVLQNILEEYGIETSNGSKPEIEFSLDDTSLFDAKYEQDLKKISELEGAMLIS